MKMLHSDRYKWQGLRVHQLRNHVARESSNRKSCATANKCFGHGEAPACICI